VDYCFKVVGVRVGERFAAYMILKRFALLSKVFIRGVTSYSGEVKKWSWFR